MTRDAIAVSVALFGISLGAGGIIFGVCGAHRFGFIGFLIGMLGMGTGGAITVLATDIASHLAPPHRLSEEYADEAGRTDLIYSGDIGLDTTTPCVCANISDDGTVSIDWSCTEKVAKGHDKYVLALAQLMLAIRDHKYTEIKP
jgi:hypothetical protein